MVEIADCDDIEVYIESLRLMYCKDLRKKLMKEDVCKVLGILKTQILKDPPCQILSGTQIHYRNFPFSAKCSLNLSVTAWFRDPRKINLNLNYVREKVWDVMPRSVKEFQWKKAEGIALHHLLIRLPELLKWPLITLVVITSMSDVLYSIALNKELLIPLGLFVGCLITNFYQEILQDLFPHSQERDQRWHILGIGCFFVLVKLVSAYFTVGRRVFLLNAANGGFMQILWLWKTSWQEQSGENVLQDSSTVMDNGH